MSSLSCRKYGTETIPQSTSDTEYIPGDVLQVDIKVFADTSKARKYMRAFGKYTGALTAVDMATGYKCGILAKSHASLVNHLEERRVQDTSTPHPQLSP